MTMEREQRLYHKQKINAMEKQEFTIMKIAIAKLGIHINYLL